MSAEDDIMQSMEVWLQSRLEDVHTMLPGRVQSYNPETRLATVKPAVLFRSLHGDTLDIPPIDSVPVVWPGSTDFSVHGTLPVGSGVTIMFSEAGIGGWLRGTQDADADDETRFSLHDAVAIPGLWPVSRVPLHQFRTAQWGMTSASAEIGGTEDGKVSIANDATTLREVLEALQAILPTMDAHHTALNAVVPGYVSQAAAINAAFTKIQGLLA